MSMILLQRLTASLTVANSDSRSYATYFNPELQNIVKSDNDQTSVAASSLNLPSGFNQVYLRIDQPIVNMHYGEMQAGYPNSEAFSVASYQPGEYSRLNGTVFFGYNIQTANVVGLNNVGAEVVETNTLTGNVLIDLHQEVILGQWNKVQKGEQQIGVPFLMDIPFLGYFFSTTTTNKENTRVYLTLTVEPLNTAKPDGMNVGELLDIRSAARATKEKTISENTSDSAAEN